MPAIKCWTAFTRTTIDNFVDLMVKEVAIAVGKIKKPLFSTKNSSDIPATLNYTFPHKVSPLAQFLVIEHGVMCNCVVQD